MNTRNRQRKTLDRSFIRLRPSNSELGLQVLIHAVASLAVLMAALSPWLQQALVIMLMLSLGVYCHRWRREPVWRLICREDQWQLSSAETAAIASKYRVLDCYYWSRWLVIIRLEQPIKTTKKYKVIFWDTCSADDFHHLRLIARYLLSADESEKSSL